MAPLAASYTGVDVVATFLAQQPREVRVAHAVFVGIERCPAHELVAVVAFGDYGHLGLSGTQIAVGSGVEPGEYVAADCSGAHSGPA